MQITFFCLYNHCLIKGLVKDNIDELLDYGHKNGLKILLESHTRAEFENSLKTEADIVRYKQ